MDCPQWRELTYHDRLCVTEFIFRQITNSPGSFRKLIYDKLGFKGDAYVPLYKAGGMLITNSIFDECDRARGALGNNDLPLFETK